LYEQLRPRLSARQDEVLAAVSDASSERPRAAPRFLAESEEAILGIHPRSSGRGILAFSRNGSSTEPKRRML